MTATASSTLAPDRHRSYRPAMRGRSIRTEETLRRLTKAIVANGGNIRRGCRAAGIAQRSVYSWREDDKSFRRELEKAVQIGLMSALTEIQDEIHERQLRRKGYKILAAFDLSHLLRAAHRRLLKAEIAALRAKYGEPGTPSVDG